MTDVEAIAKQFWAWAREKGVLATQPPDDELEPLDLEDHATKAEAQAAEVILRHRKINFIGISDEENKIIAYTQKQISRGEKEDLPEFLDGKVSIEFRRGVLPTIRNANIGGGGVSVCDQYNGRYTCGSSVFVGNREGAGTFGCLVQNAQGQLLGLSNNHVTGGLSFADLKLPITAPAVLDVSAACPDPFTIGHHHSTLALIHGSPDNAAVSENFDAATFTIKDPARVTSMQRTFYDTPASVGQLRGNTVVEKVGRTTGRTRGTVSCRAVMPQPVIAKVPEFGVTNVIFFQDFWVVEGMNKQSFSQQGDSGSLVCMRPAQGEPTAVALLFAGNSSGLSFVAPLDKILGKLNVSIVSGHNV